MKKITEFKVGEAAEIRHVITKEDVRKFVELTGDDNRLHTDEEFAGKTAFGKTIVHGMLGASFISTIIGTKLPGDGALWFAQNIEFLRPVRVGDEIAVKAEVTKVVENHNIVELRIDIFNQHMQTVTSGTCKVKIAEFQPVEDFDQPRPYTRSAVVIGASGGIGGATCLQLARDGFDVVIHYYRKENAAKQIMEKVERLGRKALLVKADITDQSEVKNMFERIARYFERVTVLVNSTTIEVPNTQFSMLKWEDIQNHLDMNIKGSFNLVKNVLPLMEPEKYGKIVFVTTQSIDGTPPAEWVPYVTAKAALWGFARALAVELGPRGIRVNLVSPGMTQTELIADIPEKTRLMTKATTPLKKLASPGDIAGAISFLAGERSDFLTGETIRVNGGKVMV